MKHLIVLDLDGTTLDNHGELTEKTIKVVQTLKNQGHLVAVATGRPFSGAYPKYEALNLDTPLITDNGGSVENPRDPNFAKQKTFIPRSMMHAIFRFSKDFIITAFFSIDDMTYAYRYNPRLEAFFSGIHSDRVIEGEHTDFTVEPTGLVYLITADYQKEFETFIESQFGHTLSFRLWGVDRKTAIYEIYLKHVSKSSAITYLLDYYGLPRESVIAFGDGVNDVEMIRDAHHGVAMKNGVDEVKVVAKDITPLSNHEEGVANYLISMFHLNI